MPGKWSFSPIQGAGGLTASSCTGTFSHGNSVVISTSGAEDFTGFGVTNFFDTVDAQWREGSDLDIYSGGLADNTAISGNGGETLYKGSITDGNGVRYRTASPRHSRAPAYYEGTDEKLMLGYPVITSGYNASGYGPSSVTKLYWSFWRYISNSGLGDGSTKLWRLASAANGYQNTRNNSGMDLDTTDGFFKGYQDLVGTSGQWHYYEAWADRDNQILRVYTDGVEQLYSYSLVPTTSPRTGAMEFAKQADWIYASPTQTGYEWAMAYDAGFGLSLFMAAGWDDGHSLSSGQVSRVSELYIQTNTRNRVVISDSATYDNAWDDATFHQEVQRITAATASTITISVNQGSFSTLSGKYLHVLGSGNVGGSILTGGNGRLIS